MYNQLSYLLVLENGASGGPAEERNIEMAENYNFTDIVTPVKAEVLEQLVIETGFCPKERQFLVDGLTNGFDLCYQGPKKRRDHSQNIPLRIVSKLELWNKLMTEVKLGRYTGPFKEVPYEYFVQSPIGLVPRDNGKKTRLIFHLSFDFKSGFKSVNHYIPQQFCSVKYNDLDHAIRNSFVWGGTGRKQSVFHGKTDVQSAFRLVPLKKSCWYLLIMKAEHPKTKRIWFFVDKCLPFGSSISCAIFQRFSDALKHIVEGRTCIYMAITNYLDDFLFVAFTTRKCNGLMKAFLEVCAMVGVPISMNKTEWACRLIIFLGVLLDGEHFCLSIPEEKRNKAIQELEWMISRKKTTVKSIQSLAGLLNYLNRAIFGGGAFTCCMYAKYSGLVEKGRGTQTQVILKSYHHVKVDQEFKADCKVWLNFLTTDLFTVVSRPFVD